MALSFSYEKARKLPEISFTSIIQVLTAVNLLTKAWAAAGAAVVDSKARWNKATNAPERVRIFHLEVGMWYDAFVQAKAIAFRGQSDEGRTVTWLLDCHRKTVNKAKTLFHQGWPWGEALKQSVEHDRALVWQVGLGSGNRAVVITGNGSDMESDSSSSPAAGPAKPPPKSGGQPQQQGSHKRKKKTQKQRQAEQNKPKCPDWQHGRCTENEQDCPNKGLHRCSKCNHWSHGADVCKAPPNPNGGGNRGGKKPKKG